MKNLLKIASLCSLVLLGYSINATERDEETTKTINRSYHVSKGYNLEITNKYGQVVINTWDKDSVKLEIKITAYGKDRSTARKTLSRAGIDIDQHSNYIIVETFFDRSSNIFGDLWKTVEEESRALFSNKTKIEVDYQVFVPQYLNIMLDNKYGDVYMQSIDGKAEILVSHGNLRSNTFNANADINVSFGDVKIKEMKSGRLTLKAAKANILKLGIVELRSSSTELIVGEADRVRLDSRSDELLKFEQISNLSGSTLFSNITIDKMPGNMSLDLTYSDLNVRYIAFNFSDIDLTAKSSDITLTIDNKAYIDVIIEAKEDKLALPISIRELDREYLDDKNKEVRLRGKVGTTNNYLADLSIRSQSGEVTINLDENDGLSIK